MRAEAFIGTGKFGKFIGIDEYNKLNVAHIFVGMFIGFVGNNI
jgi:hypothetical protein